MALVCICRFINYCCFISKTVQCQCVSLLGGLSGKTQIRQASRQLYHDSEEFPLLEGTPALPENEAVCDPNTGLGTRLSGKEVCVEMRFPKEVFLFTRGSRIEKIPLLPCEAKTEHFQMSSSFTFLDGLSNSNILKIGTLFWTFGFLPEEQIFEANKEDGFRIGYSVYQALKVLLKTINLN